MSEGYGGGEKGEEGDSSFLMLYKKGRKDSSKPAERGGRERSMRGGREDGSLGLSGQFREKGNREGEKEIDRGRERFPSNGKGRPNLEVENEGGGKKVLEEKEKKGTRVAR